MCEVTESVVCMCEEGEHLVFLCMKVQRAWAAGALVCMYEEDKDDGVYV